MLTYYNGNVKSALFHLFPNIGLDRFRFSILRMSSYPHLPPSSFIDFIYFIYYIYSFIYLFVYIIFTGNFWEDPKNKRDFFDRFAKERGFDSLIPSNWYPITLHEILATEV